MTPTLLNDCLIKELQATEVYRNRIKTSIINELKFIMCHQLTGNI